MNVLRHILSLEIIKDSKLVNWGDSRKTRRRRTLFHSRARLFSSPSYLPKSQILCLFLHLVHYMCIYSLGPSLRPKVQSHVWHPECRSNKFRRIPKFQTCPSTRTDYWSITLVRFGYSSTRPSTLTYSVFTEVHFNVIQTCPRKFEPLLSHPFWSGDLKPLTERSWTSFYFDELKWVRELSENLFDIFLNFWFLVKDKRKVRET